MGAIDIKLKTENKKSLCQKPVKPI
jgi:hypothetical protein